MNAKETLVFRAKSMTEMDAARLLVDLVADEELDLPLFTPAEYRALSEAFERGAAQEEAARDIQDGFNRP